MSERTYYLVSAAGNPNLGDDWIAWSWLRFIAEQDPDATLILDCLSPGNVASLMRGEAFAHRVVPVDFLWRTVGRFRHTDLWAARQELDASWPSLIQVYGEAWGLTTLGCPEVIHILGGGFVNGIWRENWLLIALCAKLKDHWGAELRWTGASIVPSTEVQCFDFSKFLCRFDHVSCRDENSVTLLRRSGVSDVTVGPDDIGLGVARGDIVLPATEVREPTVVVTLQRDLFEPVDYARACRDTAEFLRARGPETILYAEMSPGPDLAAFDFLVQQGFRPKRIGFADLFRATVRRSDHQPLVLDERTVFVTSRYHMHLYAALAGFSGTFVSARPDYYDVKHAAVQRWGSGWTPLGGAESALGNGMSREAYRKLCAAKLGEARQLYPVRTESAALRDGIPQEVLGLRGDLLARDRAYATLKGAFDEAQGEIETLRARLERESAAAGSARADADALRAECAQGVAELAAERTLRAAAEERVATQSPSLIERLYARGRAAFTRSGKPETGVQAARRNVAKHP